MIRSAFRLAALVLLFAAGGHAGAEVIRIPLGAQSAPSDLPLPEHGAGRAAVLAHWGEPQQRHAPVGNPPIERWDYATFSVYFENDTVLHAVVKPPARRTAPTETTD